MLEGTRCWDFNVPSGFLRPFPAGSRPQLSLELCGEVVMDVDISDGHGGQRRGAAQPRSGSNKRCLEVELKTWKAYKK